MKLVKGMILSAAMLFSASAFAATSGQTVYFLAPFGLNDALQGMSTDYHAILTGKKGDSIPSQLSDCVQPYIGAPAHQLLVIDQGNPYKVLAYSNDIDPGDQLTNIETVSECYDRHDTTSGVVYQDFIYKAVVK